MTTTTVPVLLGVGVGRPLLGPLPSDLRLEHLYTRAYDFGSADEYRVASSKATGGAPPRGTATAK